MLRTCTKRDTYTKAERHLFVIAGFLFLIGSATLLPGRVHAFWPFSINADAAVNAVVPSDATPVLVAATNTDPNIAAPIALAISNDSALIADSGPTGTPSDVSGTTTSDRISVYVVRPGDTLSEIAAMYDVSVNTIVWANDLGTARAVHPGDTLIILPVSGVERTVIKGDTLNSIAKAYNADPVEIAEFNGLDPSQSLVLGSTVIIPGGEILEGPASTSAGTETTKGGATGKHISEPYLGGSGPAQNGYYQNPLPSGVITQSIHGWNAVDIGAARGTPIHAAANGTVIVAKNGGWNGGYGNYVVITHDNGTETLYAHMTRTAVSPGQTISAGQTIGYVGMTGLATGPHLHFEVRGAANPFRNCPVGSSCSPE